MFSLSLVSLIGVIILSPLTANMQAGFSDTTSGN
jgi:hypothetical protein